MAVTPDNVPNATFTAFVRAVYLVNSRFYLRSPSGASNNFNVPGLVPTAPRSFTAAASGELTWTPPANDGRSSVSGYAVTVEDGSGTAVECQRLLESGCGRQILYTNWPLWHARCVCYGHKRQRHQRAGRSTTGSVGSRCTDKLHGDTSCSRPDRSGVGAAGKRTWPEPHRLCGNDRRCRASQRHLHQRGCKYHQLQYYRSGQWHLLCYNDRGGLRQRARYDGTCCGNDSGRPASASAKPCCRARRHR